MAVWAPVLGISCVLAIGAGVLVFKQQVDAEERRLAELRRAVAVAQAETGRLQAELAYHQRPTYLAGFAEALGIVPTSPQHLVRVDTLPPRPDGEAAGVAIIALPSGGLATVRRRPALAQYVVLVP
ncbi:MAG: hypothetical protein EA356_04615 [Geminicoccaceae bacterium]|nr:MAG: hypothetical protein EA356_04615 [Geminicoccaceae bacterium]